MILLKFYYTIPSPFKKLTIFTALAAIWPLCITLKKLALHIFVNATYNYLFQLFRTFLT